MSEERIAETLAALERGEAVLCPWCGDSTAWKLSNDAGFMWSCGNVITPAHQSRGFQCYEREIERLREALEIGKALWTRDVEELRAEIARLRAKVLQLRQQYEPVSVEDEEDGDGN